MTKTISILLVVILCLLAFAIGYHLNSSSNPALNASETAPTASESQASTKTFQWKMVTTWPPNFPIFQEGVMQLAEDIEMMSNGRLKIKVFAGGELVPPLQTFDAVSQGVVQMGHGSAYYWAGKIPAAQFMSAVPFGMTAKGVNAWFYSGGGLELWQELYEPFNVVPFPAGNSGVQMGGWFRKKIESVADLKGLKMRIPGLGGKVLAKAGGTAELLPGAEIYTALERRRIEATEWVGPFHDKRLGLHKIAEYYYYPGWHEPGTALELLVNRQAFEELPADLQKIIEIAARSINQWMLSKFEALNIKALQALKAEPGVQILAFPPDVIKELKRLTDETLAEEAAKSAAFKKVYDAYKQFQSEHAEWNAISDDAYYQALKEQS
jgi:TRAP-type mannitol/chloroaromatic compound transport system substrate-binding protein